MSLAKRSYGYGYSKPHRQNSDSLTTVVTEISRMTGNEKPCYGTGAVQKHALEKDDVVYSAGHHGGGAVQKHGYGHVGAVQKHGYGGLHGGAAQKHGYGGLHGGAAQKHVYDDYCPYRTVNYGYRQTTQAYGQHGAVVGGVVTHYESGCSDEESEDESDCEELSHGGAGVHGYQLEKHGGSHNLVGGLRHHAAYDRSSGHGSGTRYVSYETTKTEDDSGGGYGGWPAQRKNGCIISST